MNKRVQGLLAGVIIGCTLTGGMVFAKQANEWAELYYNNIRIFIDGGEIVPKDATGQVVEPFIVNGTTYLPVRAISNAFGQEVEWDGETQSIYIGKKDETKPDNYLHKIQYNDYQEGDDWSKFAVLNGTVTDYSNNVYTNGLLFYNDDYYDKIGDDEDEANILIAYPLNSQYSRLKGKIVLPKGFNDAIMEKKDKCDSSETDVLFYGDGKLIHKATSVTASMPFSFDIKVKGVNQLVIKIKTERDYSYVCIADPALYK